MSGDGTYNALEAALRRELEVLNRERDEWMRDYFQAVNEGTDWRERALAAEKRISLALESIDQAVREMTK